MKKKREIIDDILDPNFSENNHQTKQIKTKCLKCGFEEDVPHYIYEDFATKKFHKEIGKRVLTLNCQRCDTEKFIPKEYFKN